MADDGNLWTSEVDADARTAALAALGFAGAPDEDPTDMLHRVVETVDQLLPTTGGASIVLYDNYRETFTQSVSTVPEQSDNEASRRVRRSHGASRWIVDRQQPLVVARLDDDPFGANQMLRDSGLAAYAGVPLISGGESIGVLYALDRVERLYRETDIAFLQAVANRAANVILLAQAHAETRRTLRRTQAVADITAAANRLEADLLGLPGLLDVTAQAIEGIGALFVQDAAPGQRIHAGSRTDVEALPVSRLTRDATPAVLFEAETGLRAIRRPAFSGSALVGMLVVVRDDAMGDITEDEGLFVSTVAAALGAAVARTELLRELHRSNEALERFGYAVSHDLKTPLATVTGFLDLLEMQFGDAIPETAVEYVQRSRNGARRMQAMVEGLLEMARLDGRAIRHEQVDLAAVVADVIDEFGPAIEEAAATIDVGGLPTLTSDREALRAILRNLIGNALKFRAPDRAPLVTITSERADHGWVVRIVDNGRGIGMNELEHVFDLFARSSSAEDVPGTGIGLATSRSPAESLGGTLHAEHAETGGAALVLALPA